MLLATTSTATAITIVLYLNPSVCPFGRQHLPFLAGCVPRPPAVTGGSGAHSCSLQQQRTFSGVALCAGRHRHHYRETLLGGGGVPQRYLENRCDVRVCQGTKVPHVARERILDTVEGLQFLGVHRGAH